MIQTIITVENGCQHLLLEWLSRKIAKTSHAAGLQFLSVLVQLFGYVFLLTFKLDWRDS